MYFVYSICCGWPSLERGLPVRNKCIPKEYAARMPAFSHVLQIAGLSALPVYLPSIFCYLKMFLYDFLVISYGGYSICCSEGVKIGASMSQMTKLDLEALSSLVLICKYVFLCKCITFLGVLLT